MLTLNELRRDYNQACDQIENEKLTDDAHTNYAIRQVTADLCDRRNRISQQAWNEYSFNLTAERTFKESKRANSSH